MLEIILIRHGQTDWNRDRRIMGHRPVPLNPIGRGEARQLARHLKKLSIDEVFTSPMIRAVETAEFLAQGRDLKIRLAPEVAEMDYGLWIGKTFEEAMADEAFHTYFRTPVEAQAPGGEKMVAVFERAVGFIEGLRDRFKKGRIVVVSHADVIKTVLVHYLKMDRNDLLKFRIDNASMSLLWFHDTRARVIAINSLLAPMQLFDAAASYRQFLRSLKARDPKKTKK